MRLVGLAGLAGLVGLGPSAVPRRRLGVRLLARSRCHSNSCSCSNYSCNGCSSSSSSIIIISSRARLRIRRIRTRRGFLSRHQHDCFRPLLRVTIGSVFALSVKEKQKRIAMKKSVSLVGGRLPLAILENFFFFWRLRI